MVSQVHTITNNILLTIGSLKGIPGYNPLLTFSAFSTYASIKIVTFSYDDCLVFS